MALRILLSGLLPAVLSAQFSGLSSTTDGSSVYFATTLRLRNTAEPRNGKIFVATQDGVSLFRAHEPVPADASLPCAASGFADYVAAQTSASGAVALTYRAQGFGCSFPLFPAFTQLITSSGETNIPGITYLSPSGRFALTYLASTARPGSSYTLKLLNIDTGTQTPIPAIAIPFQESISLGGAHEIANDGTAILGMNDFSTSYHGYLLKPGGDSQAFPIADGMPLMIDSTATKVVYRTQSSLYILDLPTLQPTLLGTFDQFAFNLRMSDDARRLLFIRDGQVHVLDTATLTDRTLTDDPAKISEAEISGDGKMVHAVTGTGRLIRIGVDDGTQVELIGHTPYLLPSVNPIPGFTATLNGVGLSDSVINGTLPLKAWLGNVTMWIGERKVPVTQLTPNSVSILVPWDIQPDADGTIRIEAEVPGDHTPFNFPELVTKVSYYGNVGAIFRQDWTRTFVGPINTGEIIHVYGAYFGPVFPDVPEGAAAPSTEPFARITRTFTCSNAEILYAGLSPGTVERVYQIDIRIGPVAGYQNFDCSLGGGPPFRFLSLNIVPR